MTFLFQGGGENRVSLYIAHAGLKLTILLPQHYRHLPPCLGSSHFFKRKEKGEMQTLGGEMTQTLYTHMNKRNLKPKKRKITMIPLKMGKKERKKCKHSGEKTHSHSYFEFPVNQNITWLLRFQEMAIPCFEERQPSQVKRFDHWSLLPFGS
jgi:hypothetical protein